MGPDRQTDAAPDEPARKRANAVSRRSSVFKRSVLLALLVAILAILATWQWISRDRPPATLTIGTGPIGSDAHILLREVAEVTERHSESLRLEIVATRDASHNIALLNARQIDAAVIRADTPVFSDIRGIVALYPDLFHLIVRQRAPARTVQQIERLSVSIPEYDTANFRSFWVIGDHYDLPIEGFDWQAEPFLTGARRLLGGEVDALFAVRSLRYRQLIRMFEDAQLTGLDLRFISIGQAEAIAVKRPFLEAAKIPEGAFTGALPVPARDTSTLAVQRLLVTREDVGEAPLRELTRILFEHRKDLTIRFALASAIARPAATGGLTVPLHDGARAFYERDEPSFVQENAEPLALLVTVLTLVVSGLFALRSRSIAGGVLVHAGVAAAMDMLALWRQGVFAGSGRSPGSALAVRRAGLRATHQRRGQGPWGGSLGRGARAFCRSPRS